MKRHINKYKQILIWAAFSSILIVALSVTLSQTQKRKISYNFFTDAHTQSNVNKSTIKVRTANSNFDNLIDPSDLEKQISRMFRMSLVSQQLGNSRSLEQYFAGHALKVFKDLIDENSFTVVYSGEFSVSFVQKNGTLVRGLATLNVGSIDKTKSPSAISTQSLVVDIVLKKGSFNWKLVTFDVKKLQEEPLSKRKDFNKNLFGVNYYPRDYQWTQFWSNFNLKQIENDFDIIKAIPSNSVRIFLNYDDFIDIKHENYDKLTLLLKAARQRSLAVVLTLFDLKPSYAIQTISDDVLVLDRIIGLIDEGEFDVILDLKNEVDLDFVNHDEDLVRLWLLAILRSSRQASSIPLTLGWSRFEFATAYSEYLDLISYHDYAPISDAANNLSSVRKLTGGKPVYISEVGVTSSELLIGFPSNDLEQANRLEQRLNANRSADGIVVWTLYDFEKIDTRAIGHSPWLKFLQKKYGLISQAGDEKLSMQVVRKFFKEKDF